MIIVLEKEKVLTYQGILFELKEWITDTITFDSNVDLLKHLEGVKKDLLLRNLDYLVRVAEDLTLEMTQAEKESVKRLRSAVLSLLKSNHPLGKICESVLRGKGFINTLVIACDSPKMDMYGKSIIKMCQDETS